MDHIYYPAELKRMNEGEDSFIRTVTTQRQFHELQSYSDIAERSMQETGAFSKKLDQLAGAYAATENISHVRAKSMINDAYRLRKGEWMSETLERKRAKAEEIFNPENPAHESLRQEAYRIANNVGRMVEEGTKINFYRATASEASQFASNLGVTDAAAKKFIAQSFGEIENREFREWGEALDETYYKPQIEAEKAQKQAERAQKQSPQPVMS